MAGRYHASGPAGTLACKQIYNHPANRRRAHMHQSADCGCSHPGIPAHRHCGIVRSRQDRFLPDNRASIFRFPASSSILPGNCRELALVCQASTVPDCADPGNSHPGNLAAAQARNLPGSQIGRVAGKRRESPDSADNPRGTRAGNNRHRPCNQTGSLAQFDRYCRCRNRTCSPPCKTDCRKSVASAKHHSAAPAVELSKAAKQR